MQARNRDKDLENRLVGMERKTGRDELRESH